MERKGNASIGPTVRDLAVGLDIDHNMQCGFQFWGKELYVMPRKACKTYSPTVSTIGHLQDVHAGCRHDHACTLLYVVCCSKKTPAAEESYQCIIPTHRMVS